MEELLKLKALPIEVSWRRVLPPISMRLRVGECLVIEGANGSGKTLLLETIAGLRAVDGYVPPQSLLFCGDKTALKPRLTAEDNLVFYARLGGANGNPMLKAVKRALAYFSLPSSAAVATFSTGQRQRLLLARLLLGEKRLWLLDEPTANLDSEGESLLLRLISRRCRNGGGVIMTRHRGRIPPGARRLRL